MKGPGLTVREALFLLVGIVTATHNGILQTVYGFLFTEIIVTFEHPMSEQEERCRHVLLYFILLITLTLIGYTIQAMFLAKGGEGLIYRIRKLTFASLLRQDLSYYDEPANNVGSLCTRLSSDATAFKASAGSKPALIMQSMGTLVATVIVSLVYSWRFALGILIFMPATVIFNRLRFKMTGSTNKEGQAKMEDAGKIAVEGIEHIRTVAALTKEDKFVEVYNKKISSVYRSAGWSTVQTGIIFSACESLTFFAMAWAFWYAAYLVDRDLLDFDALLKVTFLSAISAMYVGRVAGTAQDFEKTKMATERILEIINREPLIYNSSEEGLKPQKNIKGKVKFSNVHFSYPTRSTVPVLQGLNLKVNPGQTLALVGSSGCGKSTTIQLLERFYDAQSGYITLDGNTTSELNISWLRSQMGLVSQEPLLFDISIRENIAYGDNSREVPLAEIIEVAKKANIHQFIVNLPLAYETNAGNKGTHLSGGQKQRIAIARALVRNPKILLLDEATSALDTESEKVVQEALDRAQQGRTSIVIAHRLSTIQNADCIAVIHQGKVVEKGTHSELIALRGKYYDLANTQSQIQ